MSNAIHERNQQLQQQQQLARHRAANGQPIAPAQNEPTPNHQFPMTNDQLQMTNDQFPITTGYDDQTNREAPPWRCNSD
jgi:hypothetical protein